MDTIVYQNFIDKLSEVLKQFKYDNYDYSDIYRLEVENYDGVSALVPLIEENRGVITDLVIWLRLVDLLILRPHGCFIQEQHLGFIEFYNSYDPVVVSLSGDAANLETIIHHFHNEQYGTNTTKIDIPFSLWINFVEKITGKQFDHAVIKNTDDDCPPLNLEYYGPNTPDGFLVDTYFDNDEEDHPSRYTYCERFNLDEYINLTTVTELINKFKSS